MTFPIRVVAIADDGQEPVHGIPSLQRTELQMETVGLTLAEGKAILSAIQRVVVEAQTAHCVAARLVLAVVVAYAASAWSLGSASMRTISPESS